MNHFKIIFFIFFSVLLTNCAKRGMPEGGPKDENPPVLIKAVPEINTTRFKEKRIRLFFDEYIKLDDFRNQLVVSPPIDKNIYTINPQSGASKYIQIDINKNLPDTSTYVFNFGESVVDNNEGNVLPFFKYVFSTGSYIDSLKITGNVKSVFNRKTEEYISTLLYPIDENFSDSIIYHSLPRYVGSTLDTTSYEISNIKEGKYLMIALNDINKNLLFDPEFEEIGFIENYIELPLEEELNFNLFREELEFEVFKPFLESNNKISFGFKGNPSGAKISIADDLLTNNNYIVTRDPEKDTINFWVNDIKYDSLVFNVTKNNYQKSYTLKYKKKEKDSLILKSNIENTLDLDNNFKILSNIPLNLIGDDFISLLNKDSIAIPFKSEISKNKYELIFDFEVIPNEKYKLSLYPNAITSFLGFTNDSIHYSFSTKKKSDYGTIRLNISNEKASPLIVQLTSFDEEVIKEKIVSSNDVYCVFKNIKPSKYFLKIIVDKNKNGKWDTGSFIKKIKPEKTYHIEKEFDVRANWILDERINLD